MLRQLIDQLRVRGPSDRDSFEVSSLLARNAMGWDAGRPLVAKPGAYTRTCAYRDDGFELLLLNWAPGATSPIHDHGDQHCWMLVLDGQLDVEDYVRLDDGERKGYAHIEASGLQRLGPGETDMRSGRYDLHRVTASSGRPTVSLHLYSGPLREYLIYDEFARRCEPTRGTYDDFLSVFTKALR